MLPTSTQLAAIQTEGRALLVEAGAGTGKTTVLVERFLYLLEQHPEWPLESVVAVTFTEKAAREMRVRLRAGVEVRARAAGAKSAWAERWRSLERLQVGTIHGLCAGMLRENAVAAALDPRFGVLDETEAGLLKEEAIRATLHHLSDEGSPALALLAGLSLYDVRMELADLLGRRGTVAGLFEALPSPDALLAKWRTEQARMQRVIWEASLSESETLRAAVAAVPGLVCAKADDKLLPHVETAQQGLTCLHEGRVAEAATCWRSILLNVGSQGAWGGKEALAEVKGWLKALREAAKALADAGALEPIGAVDEAAAQDLQGWKALWDTLLETYDRMKAERGGLDFDDLERHVARLLALDPRPERLRAWVEGIHHLMVDEFQDTNSVQQSILYALAHPTAGGRLFVVGDAKQSIYRFRQAQVAVFHGTGAEIQAATGHGAIPLRDSFRSHAALVAANNHLFDHLLQPLGARHELFEARPGPLRAARPTSPEATPPVELWLLPKKSADGGSVRTDEARRWEATLLAERFHTLRDEGYPVWDRRAQRYRPFEYGDAAILFRATTALPLYEEVFGAAGLPFLTVGGRGFFHRPEVQDLMALLAALYQPTDDMSLATVLRAPGFDLSDETLYRLRWHDAAGQLLKQPRPLRLALADPPPTDEAARVAQAAATLAHGWARAGRVEVWQLLQEILARTGYEAAMVLAGGRRRQNVAKFMEMARERGGVSLSDFLRRVEQLRVREAREGEAQAGAPPGGAVQIMSVHAAKGLEFPVVAVADLGRPGSRAETRRVLADPAYGLVPKQRDGAGRWQKPAAYHWAEWMESRVEQAESKRLLYVACTRAADLLLLSGQGRGTGNWLHELCVAWEVEAVGTEEETRPHEGFQVRVLRPQEEPFSPRARRAAPRPFDGPSLTMLPTLVAPLPTRTHAATPLLPDAERDEAPLRPFFASQPGGSDRAPGWVVERIVRAALNDWGTLTLDEAALHKRLTGMAHQEAALTEATIQHATARAWDDLASLRASSLFARLRAADARHLALPFTLTTAHGPASGTLDALFHDARGWHLVAWETGWWDDVDIPARVAERRADLALQAEAVMHTLGTRPTLSVCFLTPTVRQVTIQR